MPRMTPRVMWLTLLAPLMILAAACGNTVPVGEWFFGQTLAINIQDLQRVQELRYTAEDKQWVVRPTRDGYEIAAVQLSVRNRQAAVSILSIGKESLRMSDDKFLDYNAVDPFTQRMEVAASADPIGGASPILDKHVPFIWGPVDLPQQCFNTTTNVIEGCELKGWVLFEIPKDVGVSQVVWETSDVIYIRFKDNKKPWWAFWRPA